MFELDATFPFHNAGYAKTRAALADAAVTLTATQLLNGEVSITPTVARELQLPTAVDIIALTKWTVNGRNHEFAVINLAAFDVNLTVNTGVTIVGRALVNNGSAKFCVKRLSGSTVELTRVDGAAPTLLNGAVVASTSGTAITFTGIPPTAKRITIMFAGVSTNGTAHMRLQLGTSAGLQTAGYLGNFGYIGINAAAMTQSDTFFGIYSDAAADIIHGSLTLSLLDQSTGTWVLSSLLSWSTRLYTLSSSGRKVLSGTLDRVSIQMNGTDTFDAGSINILWE